MFLTKFSTWRCRFECTLFACHGKRLTNVLACWLGHPTGFWSFLEKDDAPGLLIPVDFSIGVAKNLRSAFDIGGNHDGLDLL